MNTRTRRTLIGVCAALLVGGCITQLPPHMYPGAAAIVLLAAAAALIGGAIFKDKDNGVTP